MNLDNMKRLIPMRIIVDEVWKDGKSLLADSGRGPSTLTSDIAIAESDDNLQSHSTYIGKTYMNERWTPIVLAN